MKLLLDTHILIWLRLEPGKLPKRVETGILEADRIGASVVSGWEYGMKRRRRPAELPLSFEELLATLSVERLVLDLACHSYAESLPPIHADPFDRMLVAQALHGGWVLATGDATVRRYPVETVWD